MNSTFWLENIQFENDVFFNMIISRKRFAKPKTKNPSQVMVVVIHTSTIFIELQVINDMFSMKMVEIRNYAKWIALFPTFA